MSMEINQRMFDIMRRFKFHTEPYSADPAHKGLSNPQEFMADAEVILADNVSEYMLATELGSTDDFLDAMDIPILAPPFAKMFIEYKMPSVFSRLMPGIRCPHRQINCGVFLDSWVLDEAFSSRVARRFGWTPKWRMEGALFLEPIPHRIVGPVMAVLADVAEDGSPHNVGIASTVRPPGVEGRPRPLTVEPGLNHMQFMRAVVTPALLTICFMNCKNVRLESEPRPGNMPRTFKRQKPEPYTEYKILEIGPVKSVLRDQGKVQHTGLKMALHICRGHFKTYTGDNKLFGRMEGTYWWGHHLRGSGPGTTVKDYRLNVRQ